MAHSGRRSQSHLVQGRGGLEDHLDRARWLAGCRSAQLRFAMSPEEAADNTQVMASRYITRVGLQDEMHAVAEPERLTRTPEELKIELQACGHRLRMHKCRVRFPGWDDTCGENLPQEGVAADDPARDRWLGAVGGAVAQGD